MPLLESISPCQNVRRSCHLLMSHDSYADQGPRSVTLNGTKLGTLAETIKQSILDKEGATKKRENKHDYFHSLDFAAWDSESWHYTGASYSRPHLSKEEESKQRYERVALYIMVLDCINFCFWPDKDTGRNSKKNLLEYEHLAEALKRLAEQDDVVEGAAMINGFQISDQRSVKMTQAPNVESTFALSPTNLMKLTTESFLKIVTKCLPEVAMDDEKSTYMIPNAEERTRLLIEMASGLVSFHKGSATEFISKANKSADKLVNLIIQNFSGFRDTAIDGHNGRWIGFYKRAQILVADLWAALGNSDNLRSPTGTEDMRCLAWDHCCFLDIGTITTFADYRVPQLLRNLGVLEYSTSLAKKVDNGQILTASCPDELYIRAGTIVAVDELVKAVRSKLNNTDLAENCNAVKIDWYLWNIGEKMDRVGLLGKHHLVRTIYY